MARLDSRMSKVRDSAWLLETGQPPFYWTPTGGTLDHSQACRFARQVDADQMALSLRQDWQVVEHLWDTAPQNQTAPKGQAKEMEEMGSHAPSSAAAVFSPDKEDTLRTDAAIANNSDEMGWRKHVFVSADLARQLERELAEAQAIANRQMNDAEAARLELAEVKQNLEFALANHSADLSARGEFVDPGEEYDGWAEKEKAEELLREIRQMTDNVGIQRKVADYFHRYIGEKK